ncbi:MAG: hypothetical protein CVU97_07060 [Firmicutes bacterium HGW-Firmicutes-21]|nr:MAG: hypothetical protein CVU97_07060 [Firmicutes bacterium HGW-Firmicutes-21]
MKKSLCLLIITIICIILPFSSCSKEEIHSNSTEQVSANNEQGVINESQVENGIGEGGNQTFQRYKEDVQDNGPIALIVGYDKFDNYIQTYIESVKNQKKPYNDLPTLYKMIQHFNISKEDFLEMVESERKNPIMGCNYTDETIELLFCGDVERMKRDLTHELAWYDNGNVYSFMELWEMSKDEIKSVFDDEDEFDDYKEKAVPYLGKNHQDCMEKLDDIDIKVKMYGGRILGEGDAIFLRYIENIQPLSSPAIDSIIDCEKLSKFIDENIEAKKHEKRPNNDAPYLYQIIDYFNISKKEFTDMVIREREKAYPACDYTNETIELLFCGDVEKMKKGLTHELAWYDNGNVYSFHELWEMSKDEIKSVFDKEGEFDDYKEKVLPYLETNYESYLNKLDYISKRAKG